MDAAIWAVVWSCVAAEPGAAGRMGWRLTALKNRLSFSRRFSVLGSSLVSKVSATLELNFGGWFVVGATRGTGVFN